MNYCVVDFSESVDRASLHGLPRRVLFAFGVSEDSCCSDWRGGFILEMNQGQIALLTGWCDYTGWGCQDGAESTLFPTLSAALEEVKTRSKIEKFYDGKLPPIEEWDQDPADLNKWLKDGSPTDRIWAWKA